MTIFENKINEIRDYLNTHNQIIRWNDNRELRIWISKKFVNYKRDRLNKDEEDGIKKLINDYPKIFSMDMTKFNNESNEFKNLLIENKRKPKQSNIKEKHLKRFWKKFRDKIDFHFYTNENELKIIYKNFVNDIKYKEFLKKKTNVWEKKLNNLKDYININNQINDNIKILNWIKWQKKYCNITNELYNDEIVNLWNEFINDEKYNKYL